MESKSVAIKPDMLTPAIVKERVCPEASDQEIFLFLQIAKSCNLNPFLNQIYLVKYGNQRAQILTSYNVYLQRAERSGMYGGLETATEGTVVDGTLKAVVKVFRKDWERPLIHEVYYVEYVQKTRDRSSGEIRPNRFWEEKPRTMIVKVAISQAFRLAFPLEFEGMPYTRDEMSDDLNAPAASSKPDLAIEPKAKDAVEDALVKSDPEPKAERDIQLIKKIEALAKLAFDKKKHSYNDWIVWEFNVNTLNELGFDDLKVALEKIKKLVEEKNANRVQ